MSSNKTTTNLERAMRTCLRCGGGPYADPREGCVHRYVPMPERIERAETMLGAVWVAKGPGPDPDVTPRRFEVEHPMREVAVEQWRERWLWAGAVLGLAWWLPEPRMNNWALSPPATSSASTLRATAARSAAVAVAPTALHCRLVVTSSGVTFVGSGVMANAVAELLDGVRSGAITLAEVRGFIEAQTGASSKDVDRFFADTLGWQRYAPIGAGALASLDWYRVDAGVLVARDGVRIDLRNPVFAELRDIAVMELGPRGAVVQVVVAVGARLVEASVGGSRHTRSRESDGVCDALRTAVECAARECAAWERD